MEGFLQTILGIVGIGLFGSFWYILTILSKKIDKSEQIQSERFNDFKEFQSKLFDIQNEKQAKLFDVQNEKFDILIREQQKITAQLTNHVTDLQKNQKKIQEKQDKMQEKQDRMQEDLHEIKALLQKR